MNCISYSESSVIGECVGYIDSSEVSVFRNVLRCDADCLLRSIDFECDTFDTFCLFDRYFCDSWGCAIFGDDVVFVGEGAVRCDSYGCLLSCVVGFLGL